MSRRPAQQGLYSTDDSGPPRLQGCRCRACGFVFFPPHTFGCERCGAPGEETESMELRGEGVLDSFATVHQHGGGGEVPFTVGEIVLDDGPMVRALLVRGESGQEGRDPVIGGRVRALLWSLGTTDQGDERVELRFAPIAAEEVE